MVWIPIIGLTVITALNAFLAVFQQRKEGEDNETFYVVKVLQVFVAAISATAIVFLWQLT